MSARAVTNTFLHCALLISPFFIHFWKIQAQMWREQEKPQTSIYTHAHNVRTAHCYFVQAVKICPGQRESPQKQQLSCFSEETSVTSGMHAPLTCCMSDMLANWSYFISLILSGNSPQVLKPWLLNSRHLCACTHFKDFVAAVNQWRMFSCAISVFKKSDWHALIVVRPWCCSWILPELTSVERAEVASGSSPPGPPILQLWPFSELSVTGRFVWKVLLKKKKQCTSWFWCILLPLELTHLFFFSAAHYCFPFLGLPAAGWPTKIPTPWPCDIRAPNVWPMSTRNSREKSLQCWCSNRVWGLPREAFCRELALGR